MRQRYPIDDAAISDCLNFAYGVRTLELDFVPLGDSAYSYIVSCLDGQRYFLKIYDRNTQRGREKVSRFAFYLPVSRYLHDSGLFRYLTYPLSTRSGQLSHHIGSLSLVLFNFIPGHNLADAYPFSETIHEKIAEHLAMLHSSTVHLYFPEPISEQFDVSFFQSLRLCLAKLEHAEVSENVYHRRLAELVLPRRAEIDQLLARLKELQRAVVSHPREMVLCHGDVWGGNLILSPDGELYLVDWESAILAPPECDLQNYLGEESEYFFAEYERKLGRRVALDPKVYGFYQYRRHLVNLTAWMINILYDNFNPEQSGNDLEMIEEHCLGRWTCIEPTMQRIASLSGISA